MLFLPVCRACVWRTVKMTKRFLNFLKMLTCPGVNVTVVIMKSKLVEHAPDWFAGPLRINAAGDTRPGFMCCHTLENGHGLCGSTSFEELDTPHVCFVMVRGWWKFSRPCYDKYHRCPGWAGGGWKYRKNKLCDNGRINVDYEDRWWKWKTHRCRECDVVVLPYMVRYTSPRSVWYRVERLLRR